MNYLKCSVIKQKEQHDFLIWQTSVLCYIQFNESTFPKIKICLQIIGEYE